MGKVLEGDGMGTIEFFKREWGLIMAHPWEFVTVAVIVGGAAFGVSEYHYSGRIAGLTETLQTKEFPKPVVTVVSKLVPDPKQAQEIADLRSAIDGYKVQISNLKKVRSKDIKTAIPPDDPGPPGALISGSIKHFIYGCNVGLGGVKTTAGSEIGDAQVVGNTNGAPPPVKCDPPKTPQ